jgi:hypothetical protein
MVRQSAPWWYNAGDHWSETMIHTSIESIDPSGREVPADPDLKRRVERAAELLKIPLKPVDTFPIEARWRIVHQPDSSPRVELDLTSDGVGIRGWMFDTTDWTDDTRILRSVRRSVAAFGRAISPGLRAAFHKALDEFRQFAAQLPLTAGE